MMTAEQRKTIKKLIEKMERGSLIVGTIPEIRALHAVLDADEKLPRHCSDCDRPELCDIILKGTGPCGANAGVEPDSSR